MKLDGDGDTLWTRSFEITNQSVGDFGSEQERNGHVVETNDSMILVGFHHLSFTLSTSDPDQFCLVKMTPNGNVLRSKSYSALNEFQLTGIQQALDSSIYLVGRARGSQIDGYLVNLSESGQINWTKRYNGVELMDIETDSSGVYLGWANYSSQSGVMKVSLNGDQIRRIDHYLPISGDLPEVSITRRSNGNILSCPEAPPFDNFFGGFVEMDDSLNLLSSYEVYMMMDQLLSIPNKGVYAIGFGPLYVIKAGDEEMGVIRFDSLMNVSECSYTNPMGISEEVALTTGTPVFSQSFSDSVILPNLPIQYETRGFISEDGCVTFLGSVDEIEGTWNETVSPNPSPGEFKIDWNEYRNAEIVIYNAIGKEVFRSRARSSFMEIDLQSEQDGIYYYRLTDENGSQSNGKLILMR
ncbi:MAG: T9SS type A sorting domain-containing protein [Crocinitomicaceae bacterium]|nr:T9SS type A sorting domain-containing protein [Crocinitomicaceae bacterium]